MEITIREAGASDVPIIVRLIHELAESAEERSPLTDAYAIKYLSIPNNQILLAEANGQVIGLLSYSLRMDLYHGENTCWIDELVVQESARGQGVGSKLLNQLISQLENTDCAELSVTTLLDNTEAIKFYKKHGLVDEALLLEKHFE